MSLRLNTNVVSEVVQQNLRKSTTDQTIQMERLSSGKRINRAADDASGLARATKMGSDIASSRQAKRNASDGISLIQTAEGGLNESTNLLTRMRELSVQSASDVLSDDDRVNVDMEFQQMSQELDRISNTTKYNGVDLINGESENGVMSFHVGPNADENNVIEFDSEAVNASADGLGVSGASVASKDDALSSMADIDSAISAVSGHRASLGAVQNRLQSAISNLDSNTVSLEAGKSGILDTDIAEASSKLASANIRKSGGIAILQQANMSNASLQRLIG